MTSMLSPASPPPSASATAASPASVPASRPPRPIWWAAAAVLIAVVAGYLGVHWFTYRLSHSITDDAFVEAHIVNIAPQSVSGHLVRVLVEENDRVEQGQVLAEIDPLPYRDQVNIARSKVDTARAELRRQEAALERLRKEIPIQIEIARRSFAAAEADQARAREALKLTEDEVVHGIDEARAGLAAAKADLVLAGQEYTRYTNLEKVEAVPLRRAQEVTRSRDAAEAHKNLAAAKLAKAQADPTP